jgi:tetratricopeptide (TPR) repeat protein
MRTGSTLIFQGRPQEGIVCCDSALSLSPSPYDARMIRSIRAYGSLRAGDADTAVAALDEATAWFAESKLQYTWTYFSLWLTEGWLRQGRRPAALERAEHALRAARTYGYRHLEGLALRMIGESLAPQDAAGARDQLERARGILTDVGARNDLAKTLVLLAGLSPSGGRALLEQAQHEFRALGTVDEIPRIAALLTRAG